jgi:glucosamine--fructose-6-phosphate aminotransferase (isomerizing)
MCGIFGYVGKEPDAARIVLSGLRKIEYRGYDSWGVAVGGGARVSVEKQVGRIGQAQTHLEPSGVGLGHTRWATHGGVTHANAHPHLDCSERLAVIHNGIVTNHAALRAQLTRVGHRFLSETDSEVVAHLVEELLDPAVPEADRLLAATVAAFRRLSGLNAIVVLDAATGRLAAAKNGSPLVVGHGEHGGWLTSDAAALLPHTRRVTYLEDGQAASVGPEGCRMVEVDTAAPVVVKIEELAGDVEQLRRGSHPDFMSKEIAEQPALLRRLAADSSAARSLAVEIRAARETYVIGCGSAGHAALVAQYLLASIAACRVTAVTASEFPAHLPFVGPGSLVVACSQSGETMDVLEAVRAARARGARIAALVNVPGSSLFRMADVTALLQAGPEVSVLATKSFSAKLAIFLQVAHLLAMRDVPTPAIQNAAIWVQNLLTEPSRARIRALATCIDTAGRAFVLGRGPSFPLAQEAALKIKEVSYLHAEAFAAGELKHGVIAMIEPGTPCLLLAPPDTTAGDTHLAAEQVRARGAFVIGIAPELHASFDHHIPLPGEAASAYLVQSVPIQLLAYELARLRGHDPDHPRHLAKSVTVK